VTPEPFQIAIAQPVLDDLRERILRTRWPDQIAGSGWEQGTDGAALRGLLDHWANRFDWRAQEQVLNRLGHFRTELDGLGLHFIHERGRGPKALPLILTHGWPSSFLEMTRLIPHLVDPAAHGASAADSFDVVAPSLPGMGFSDRPRSSGMTKTRIAGLWNRLMTEVLGYPRYGARGGDIGAGITSWLGFDHPAQVIGIHVSDVLRPFTGSGAAPLTAAEAAFVETEARWMETDGAYDHQMRTRPQTLAYGLYDSPAGMAAWIVEKLRSWSDCGGELSRRFSLDELATSLTLYWATGTISSANRLYYDRDRPLRTLGPGQRVPVPTAVALFPADIDQPPPEWAERAYDLRRFTRMPRGGHFAAFEEPALLAADLRDFFRPLRAG
jgi:pimeloyl-ACP methyl ester carboxylesterase